MDKQTESRVVLVDPGFSSDRIGHHWKLNCGYAHLLGVERCWFAVHRSLRATPGLGGDRLIPTFRISHYEAEERSRLGTVGVFLQGLAYRDHALVPRPARSVLQSLLRLRRSTEGAPFAEIAATQPGGMFTRELCGLLDRVRPHPQSHLVFPSLDTHLARSLLDVIAMRGIQSLPMLHLRLMYDDATRSGGGLDYEGLVERLAATGQLGRRIRLYCETERHAVTLRRQFGASIGVAPFPAGTSPPPEAMEGRPLRVTFLGEARAEKGFELIEPAITAFCAQFPDLVSKVAWRIHVGGRSIEAARARDRIRMRPWQTDADIQFHFGSLSPQDYERVRGDADVVLALQDPGVYGRRGSGVLQEAVAGGRPFIHRGGVSLDPRDGAAGIEANSPDEIAEAIATIARRPGPWFARARAASAHFLRRIEMNDLVKACAAIPRQEAERPTALVVGPWMGDSGSSRLMSLQCRALTELGYQVVRVHLARSGHRPAETLTRALRGGRRDRHAILSIVVESAGREEAPWTHASLPGILKDLFDRDAVRLILGNFPQSSGWIERLPVPADCIRIMETHDLRLDPVTGAVNPDAVGPVAGYHAAVFVNDAERDLWAHAGQPNCRTILPPINDGSAKRAAEAEEVFDLIFVGTDQARNREALRRLTEDVLDHPGMGEVSLLVVGDVAAPGSIRRPNSIAKGRVEDLDAAYGSARMAIVPFGGEGGIPSKVFGALCRHRPLVADAAAVAFLPNPRPFAVADAAAMRDRILALLGNAAKRRAAAAASRETWGELSSWPAYRDAWRGLLADIDPAAVRFASAGKTRIAELEPSQRLDR